MSLDGRDPGQVTTPLGAVQTLVGAVWQLGQTEAAMARLDIDRAGKDIARAAVFAVLGLVLLLVALILLVQAAVHGVIALGLAPGWANLLVGLGAVILALILAQLCRLSLRRAKDLPARVANRASATLRSLMGKGTTL